MNSPIIKAFALGLCVGCIGGVLVFVPPYETTKGPRATSAAEARTDADRDTARVAATVGARRFPARAPYSGPPAANPDPAPQDQLTAAELRKLAELSERRARGEYVNLFEDPLSRRQLRERIDKGSELLAGANRTNLGSFATQVGLPQETTDRILSHVSRINEAAMEVQAALLQLETARAEYDRRIRGSMDDRQLEAYRAFEATQPARRELDAVRQFASAKNLALGDDQEGRILNVIREAEAYTVSRYLGPYDSLPVVAVGKDKVLANARHQLEQLQQAGTRVDAIAEQQGLSPESRSLLVSYLAESQSSRASEIDAILDPATEQRMREELRRRVDDDLRVAQQAELSGGSQGSADHGSSGGP